VLIQRSSESPSLPGPLKADPPLEGREPRAQHSLSFILSPPPLIRSGICLLWVMTQRSSWGWADSLKETEMEVGGEGERERWREMAVEGEGTGRYIYSPCCRHPECPLTESSLFMDSVLSPTIFKFSAGC
jgi:hypothetical protein